MDTRTNHLLHNPHDGYIHLPAPLPHYSYTHTVEVDPHGEEAGSRQEELEDTDHRKNQNNRGDYVRIISG